MQKNNEDCLVSIIIPIYNVEKYLHACIDSVLRQTFRNLEIILVNDGSTDNSADICDNYSIMDSRIQVIHRDNGGMSEARNTGITVARGKYIYFLDSDDWIRDDAIEILVNVAERNNCEVVMFDAIVTDESGIKLDDERFFVRKFDYPELSGAEMYNKMWANGEHLPNVWAYIFLRELIISEKLLFIPGLIHQDGPFTFSLLIKARSVCHIKEQLYYRRIRMGSVMHSPVTIKNLESYFVIMRDIFNTFSYSNKKNVYESMLLNLNWYFERLIDCFDRLPESEKIKSKGVLLDAIDFATKVGATKAIDFNKINDKEYMIWYGGGERCKILLNRPASEIPDEIWDVNADNIISLHNIPVVKPDYPSLLGYSNRLLVVCIDNKNVLEDVMAKCAANGFYNVCDWQYYLAMDIQSRLK